MERHIITFAVILFSLVSCKQNGTSKVQITGQNLTVESRTGNGIEDTAIVNSKQFVQNDSLRMQLYSDLEKLTDNFTFAVDKKPIKNRHIDNVIDTIITLEADNIKLTSYKTSSEEWIYQAEIKNCKVKFLDSIQVGMKKDTLEKILKRKLNSDLIEVGNMEQTSVFIFQFENDILSEIKFDGYVD